MKKKIKLKDLTKALYLKWRMVYKNPNNCSGTCEKCPLRLVHCHPETKECWIYHTEMFTDKFLNKTIEIEISDILTKEEKEYLLSIIKPFKDRIDNISKSYIEYKHNSEIDSYEYIRIEVKSIKNYSDTNLKDYSAEHLEAILLPYFKSGTLYKGMVARKKYTLRELEL